MQQTQCERHEEIFVGFDMDPLCDPKYKHCCAKCFAERKDFGYVKTYKDANELLENAKKKFKNECENQWIINLQTLQELIDKVIQLQAKQKSILDQLLENLRLKIASIEKYKENFDQKLDQINLDIYTQEGLNCQEKGCEVKELQQIVQVELDNFSENKLLEECKEKLTKLDIQTIKLHPPNKQNRNGNLGIGFKCTIHQEEIEFFNFRQQEEHRILCRRCINGNVGTIKQFSELDNLWNEYKLKKEEYIKVQQKEIDTQRLKIQKLFKELQDNFNIALKQAMNSLSQKQSAILTKYESKLNQMKTQWHHLNREQVNQIVETLSQPEMNQILKEEIDQDFQQYNGGIQFILAEIEEKFENLLTKIKNTKVLQGKIKSNFQSDSDKSTLLSSFTAGKFQPVNQTKKNIQKEICYAIAFDKKTKRMIAGCEQKIKIFDFESGQLRQVQLLSEHQSNIVSLYVMNQSNHFISGSSGNSIFIWNSFIIEQKIKQAHNHRVNCILMNSAEDLIISCSDDKSIKFWRKTGKWVTSQVLLIHQDKVLGISFNDEAKRLVSYGKDRQIVISVQTSSNDDFIVLQKLDQIDIGSRICFIASDLITFQPQGGGCMQILSINKENKLFECQQKLKIDEGNDSACFFPQQLARGGQILVNKHKKTIYLVKVLNQGSLSIQQRIDFESEHIYGAITTDGEYLVTWDKTSEMFQVFKNQ